MPGAGPEVWGSPPSTSASVASVFPAPPASRAQALGSQPSSYLPLLQPPRGSPLPKDKIQPLT